MEIIRMTGAQSQRLKELGVDFNYGNKLFSSEEERDSFFKKKEKELTRKLKFYLWPKFISESFFSCSQVYLCSASQVVSLRGHRSLDKCSSFRHTCCGNRGSGET